MPEFGFPGRQTGYGSQGGLQADPERRESQSGVRAEPQGSLLTADAPRPFSRLPMQTPMGARPASVRQTELEQQPVRRSLDGGRPAPSLSQRWDHRALEPRREGSRPQDDRVEQRSGVGWGPSGPPLPADTVHPVPRSLAPPEAVPSAARVLPLEPACRQPVEAASDAPRPPPSERVPREPCAVQQARAVPRELPGQSLRGPCTRPHRPRIRPAAAPATAPRGGTRRR